MMSDQLPLSPHGWMRDLFDSKAVAQGRVIRRARRDIERYVGMDLFLAEIDQRGFQALQNRDQIIIICNRAPIRRLR